MVERTVIRTGSNVHFEYDPTTQETIMYVCGSRFTSKKGVGTNVRLISAAFRDELAEKSNIICPTDLDSK